MREPLPVKEKPHSLAHALIMFAFVFSLGIGEVWTVGPIKGVYVTAALAVLAFFFEAATCFRHSLSLGLFSDRRRRPIYLFCLLFALYPLVCLLWAKDLSLFSQFYRAVLINSLIVFLLLSYIRDKRDWLLIASAVVLLLAVSLGVGIWEINSPTFEHVYTMPDWKTWYFARNMPMTFYGNINDSATFLYYGAFLSMVLFLLTLAYFPIGKRSVKNPRAYIKPALLLLFLALTVLAVYEVKVSLSRAVYYGMLLTAAAFPLFYFYLRVGERFRRRGRYLIFFVLFLAAVFLAFLVVKHPLSYYIEQITPNEADAVSDNTRLDILTNGFLAFLPTFGLGLGAGQSVAVSGINLHNFFAELLFDYGVFVGGLGIALFFSLASLKKSALARPVRTLIASFPFLFLLVGISSSKALSLRQTWVLFVLLFTLRFFSLFEEKGDAREL